LHTGVHVKQGTFVQVEQLALAAGVTPRMVRHYANSGLLGETRTPNGYRHFDPAAVGHVQLIQRLVQSGLPLKDIRALWPCLTAEGEFDSCDAARDLLDQHARRLEEMISKHHATLQQLRDRQRLMIRR
jgi:DNA-binding transcriptional MerR regulator